MLDRRPLIEPVHVGTVGGRPLRFFRSPLADGRPDMPWHSVDDLHRCLGMNRAMRKFFLAKLREGKQAQAHHTIATAEGIAVVAPHFMAQGTLDALIDDQRIAPASTRTEYDREGSEALGKLMPPALEFGTDAWFAWMKAAMHRWGTPSFAGGRDDA
jgi:hypothetical protein